MRIRHLARQRALQLLYSLHYNSLGFEEGEKEFLQVNAKRRKGWGPFAHQLAERTYEWRDDLDEEIGKALKNWSLSRLAVTDRLCLRMALCELRAFDDIPLRVTLNEYIELARLFGEEKSPQYVNGVLDHLARNFRHKDFQKGGGELSEPVSPDDASAEVAAAQEETLSGLLPESDEAPDPEQEEPESESGSPAAEPRPEAAP